MANTLDIRTSQSTLSSVTTFVVAKDGSVTIQNDAGSAASISFIGPSPLCTNGSPQSLVALVAGASKTYAVCPGLDGQTFRYKASVTGAAPEAQRKLLVSGSSTTQCPPCVGSSTNPIVIFEREVPIGLVALVFGVLIGFAAARMLGPRKT